MHSQRKSWAYTVIELVVVMGIATASVAVLIPAVTKAHQSFRLSGCRNNAHSMVQAVITYSTDHQHKFTPDFRKPAFGPLRASLGFTWVLGHPQNYTDRGRSWFGQLEAGYLGGNLDNVDCPVVGDHRKYAAGYAYRPPWIWPTDYVMNALAVNVSLEMADEPGQNVLIGEPNAGRGTVSTIAHVYSFMDWGYGQDLEQTVARSLSFGFVDGHADRIPVPPMSQAEGAAFPGLALAGNPPANPWLAFGNTMYLNRSQLTQSGYPILPPPNNLKDLPKSF